MMMMMVVFEKASCSVRVEKYDLKKLVQKIR
jgi:hypothetical protein